MSVDRVRPGATVTLFLLLPRVPFAASFVGSIAGGRARAFELKCDRFAGRLAPDGEGGVARASRSRREICSLIFSRES